MIKRAGKSSADQKLELLIREKFSHVLPANPLSDAGMKNFNFAIIDVAAYYPDAISISARFIPEPAQKLRAFRRQSKRDRNHSLICFATGVPNQSCFDAASTMCTTKLFFSTVAGSVDPGSAVVLGEVAVAGVVDPGLAPSAPAWATAEFPESHRACLRKSAAQPPAHVAIVCRSLTALPKQPDPPLATCLAGNQKACQDSSLRDRGSVRPEVCARNG